MRKIINVITGVIAGFAPLIIAGIFGVLIYNELQNWLGILICLVLVIAAVWLGTIIFNKVQKMGIVDFIAVVKASPDLDNLEPTAGSKTKKRTPAELAELSAKNQMLFKGGTLKIFGDWHGEPYQNQLEIESIYYDEWKKLMIINFEKNTRVLIEEPDHILESPTVLKIVTAKKVKLEFEHRLKNSNSTKSYFKAYTVLKKQY